MNKTIENTESQAGRRIAAVRSVRKQISRIQDATENADLKRIRRLFNQLQQNVSVLLDDFVSPPAPRVGDPRCKATPTHAKVRNAIADVRS